MSPATAAAGETPHERRGTERQDKAMPAGQDLSPGAEPLRDQPVAILVMRARNGDLYR
jgi:hypothetical protein